MASHDTENIPKGKGSEKGKGKLRTSCRVGPDECVHPESSRSARDHGYQAAQRESALQPVRHAARGQRREVV
eukprot:1246415-Pyramimonas_sp.AAC.1